MGLKPLIGLLSGRWLKPTVKQNQGKVKTTVKQAQELDFGLLPPASAFTVCFS